MQHQFLQYNQIQQLFAPKERILIAVSGGRDSVVLCDLFAANDLAFGIAHCNFKLRGKASDGDEAFVKELAKKYNVPCFCIAFETEKIAQDRKTSIQIAARDLRYDWLENIRQNNDFQYIATGHHLNDNVETVLYNLAKGCGIYGLHGILPKKGFIIRPLLFATRKEVNTYVEKHQLPYREDASNASIKYARNRIRHEVIPALQYINPALEQTFEGNIQRFKEVELLYKQAIEQAKKIVVQKRDNQVFINIPKLLEQVAPNSILYEILLPYGFRNTQVSEILASVHGLSGGQFLSPTHRLIRNREELIVLSLQDKQQADSQISKSDIKTGFTNDILSISLLDEIPKEFPRDKNIALFDLDKLSFPLTLRHWQQGDYFCPIGMKGKHKKVSDFFTDLKLSIVDKNAVWLLVSGEDICWVVGYRMDERFKITAETQKVCKVYSLF